VTYVDEKAAVQEAIRSIINTSAQCVHARTVDTTRSEEFRTENGPSENYPAAVQATSLSAEQRRMGDSSAAASLSPLSSHDFEQLAPEEFIELMQVRLCRLDHSQTVLALNIFSSCVCMSGIVCDILLSVGLKHVALACSAEP
jgi:hypothetical protein